MLRIFLVVLICFAFASNSTLSKPANCRQAVIRYGQYGMLPIKVPSIPTTFDVKCEHSPAYLRSKVKDAWNIILRRQSGNVSFNRSWHEYHDGFGSLFDDFFLGLKYIHALTDAIDNELWVQLEDWRGNKSWALYDQFTIGDKTQGYAITSLGNYSGNAGDSLRYHVGNKFTTFDKDNDNSELENCAKLYSSGWWFNKCIRSNLNGLWLKGEYNASFAHGIVWKDWLGLGYSLKYAHMAIRPKGKEPK